MLTRDPVSVAGAQLRERLEAAEQRAFELQESLAAAHEELEAVREINRELLAARVETKKGAASQRDAAPFSCSPVG